MAKKDVDETKKDIVNETKKVKDTKKKNNKKAKKTERKAPKENYFVGVRSELSKVKWPSKKEVLKYTIATIAFVLVLVGFFLLMSVIMAWVREVFN